MESLSVILLPIILTALIAVGLRAAAGAERGASLAGIAVAGGFIVSWGFLLAPGWTPEDSFARIGHIAGGAALAGLVLDFLGPKRFWAAAVAGIVIFMSTWANLNNGFVAAEGLSAVKAASFLVLAVGAFIVIARLDRLRDERAVSYVAIVMVALALSVQAAIVGDSDVAVTALILGLCVGTFALLQIIVPVLLGDSVILGAGAGLLAIAWAVAERDPSTRIGLILVPLILFADGTAKHVPLPNARISSILYPIVLMCVAALPLGLGALITFVMYGP